MNDMRATISKNIRDFRKAAGLTQSELADKVGKAKTAVASWEQGKSLPSPDTLYTIAEILGKTVADFYGLSTCGSWIPVEKALPPTNVRHLGFMGHDWYSSDVVLAYCKGQVLPDETCDYVTNVCMAYYDKDQGEPDTRYGWSELISGEEIDVIAWMPVPDYRVK